MWEISIRGDKYDISNFYSCLKTKFLLNNSIFLSLYFDKNSVLKIAVTDNNYVHIVKNIITETIISVHKFEYLKNNLCIKNTTNEISDFVLHSLVMLGIDEEIDYARVRINFDKCIHIRSLVKFRLAKFYSLWSKLIDYINYYLCGENKCEKLLKFLASNVSTSQDIFYICFDQNCVVVKDDCGCEINKVYYDNKYMLAISLLMLSPKKIIIDCSQRSNVYKESSLELLSYVFDDRLCIIM